MHNTTNSSLDSLKTERFQILALSGGGFRGLFTAKILADLEQHTGGPIARHFDLLAGTSIGGILALALASEIPANTMVKLFEQHGADIFSRRRFNPLSIRASTYQTDRLLALLSDDRLFGTRLLSSCKHRVIVPSINYSTGNPVVFKTSHHENVVNDHGLKLVDIALATSAAPTYFPRHVFNNNQYVDGGLFANAPGLLALHEAEKFLGQDSSNVWAVSIGTMSSRFTVNPAGNRNGGTYDWGGWNPADAPKRLFGLAISVQESITHFMLGHRLENRYAHVDEPLTDKKASAVALDKTDAAAREALLGSASEASKSFLGAQESRNYLRHVAAAPRFFHNVSPREKR
ncbi:MAG TPA: CBASS cGAMP-activated phospholipase [Hyphomicrobiaceae bacterium]|nr:CBASS cGAMP-activated phospholipase [Hyphomicrobiaceae bacterium]